MIRGRGYLPDAHDDRDWTVARLLGGATEVVPEVWDRSPYVDQITDQGPTSACVGHALTGAARLWARLRNMQVAPLSALATYTLARARLRNNSGEPLIDMGSSPRAAAQVMKEWGFVPEKLWPSVPEHVNAELPPDVLQYASDHALEAYYRITSFGEQRSRDVRQALAKDCPVALAIAVDSWFSDTDGTGILPEPADGLQADHYIYAVGYKPGAIRVCNSWGTSWGARGFAWISDERLQHPSTQDLVCVTVARLS